ncbi:FeoA family protein [Croceicoccus bisphenolivorans]|uniref:FeoA family protein n=1 Tax=Croceicoccus bisphenolivorans TaxID=1783232 RepID=UPI00082A5F47|nr:FeoA family protein [Croceicoccus bisphenolivorans]
MEQDSVSNLADQPLGTAVRVVSVDWDRLESGEARRLHALGIDRGAVLKLAHRGIFAGRDPLAVEIGRMTVALRREHALAIAVEDAGEETVHPAQDFGSAK